MLILPMQFGAFQPHVFITLKVEQAIAAIGRSETFPRALLMLHDAQIQVAGDANVKACLYGCRECRCSCRTWHEAG